jgi:hypothetical protein
MKNKFRFALLAIFGVILAGVAAVPTLAHHSFSAEFNQDLPATFTGTLTGIDWINPHVQLYLDEKNADGTVTHWKIESGPTAHFRACHLKKEMFQTGQVLTMRVSMAKDRTKNFAWMRNATFVGGSYDGQSYEFGAGGLDEHGNPIQE